jgi:hypothetical protein
MKKLYFIITLLCSINIMAKGILDLSLNILDSNVQLESARVILVAGVKPNIFHRSCRTWIHDADEPFNGHWAQKTIVSSAEIETSANGNIKVYSQFAEQGGKCKFTPQNINLTFSDKNNQFESGELSLWFPRTDFDFDSYAQKILVEKLSFSESSYNRLEVTADADAIRFISNIEISSTEVVVED